MSIRSYTYKNRNPFYHRDTQLQTKVTEQIHYARQSSMTWITLIWVKRYSNKGSYK